MFNKTIENVRLLNEYGNKNFEVGNGTSHPFKMIKGLEMALAKITEMKKTQSNDNWTTRCKCTDTNECFVLSDGEIKKQNC